MTFFDILEPWDGVGVLVRRDQPTGTWIFIALHDDTLGPATGGCRMKVYERPEDGLRDALRLSEGMTYKWAAMDFPFGGGKTVLAVPRPLDGEERRGLLHRYGAILNSLGGRYGTGADLGTTTEDMLTIAEVSEHVIGVHGRTEGPMDPSPFTALGVFEGIRAAVRHVHGSDDLSGRRILVEGVGAVGGDLVRRLADAGAALLVADLATEAATTIAGRYGGHVVPLDEVPDTECEVYAPCAVGATLNRGSIERLRAGIVAGAANNQLATPADAASLHERGIVYAPDYVINGGGAMAFTSLYLGADVPTAEARVRGIGSRIETILKRAMERDESPVAAARELAEGVLARGSAEGVVQN
ncbi:MAG: Glu/Leu/Phe/Val dehydrogenase dimerization domain-containing protein [Gemmatimonadota bacterium]